VVGIGFVPAGPHNSYDAGGWLTPGGYQRLFDKGFKFHSAQIALRPGADAGQVQVRLTRAGVAVAGKGFQVGPPPWDSRSPRCAGSSNCLWCSGSSDTARARAVGHALATAVRRRRHDVAVLRALG